MSTTVGQAYVQILPTTKGIKGKLTSALAGEADDAGRTTGTTLGSKMGSFARKAIVAAGIGAAISKSITQGSQLQQSLGGVETLFKQSANKVKQYAAQSYKTTGLSANEYMQNVTSFSASLISSLGGNTRKAADLANTAMVDMSDNANKMGTDMETITQTYQSLARGNYAMLDNLKLGYGGTKTEMERLMADAEKLTGEHYTVGDFGDTVKAIHAIQKNLGITGTTAKEAATTFEGSFNQMKAAANDLLGNIALGTNIKQSMQNLTVSIKTFVQGNLLPMLQNIVDALPQVLDGLEPAIASLLPVIIKGVSEILTSVIELLASSAPQLASLAVTLASALIKGFASVDWGAVGVAIMQGIGDSFKANPGATAAGLAALGVYMKSKLSGVFGSLGGFKLSLGGLKTSLVDAGETAYLLVLEMGDKIKSGFSVVKSVASVAAGGIKTAITTAFSAISSVIGTVISGIRTAFSGLFAVLAANPIIAVIAGIAALVVALVVLYHKSETFRNFVNTAVASIKSVVLSGISAIAGVPGKISAILTSIKAKITAVFTAIKAKITEMVSVFKNGAIKMLKAFVSGISSMAKKPVSAISKIVSSLVSKVTGAARKFMSAGSKLISNLASGIRNAAGRAVSAVKSIVSRAYSAARNAGNRFVSIGRDIISGIARGIRGAISNVTSAIGSLVSNAISAAKKKLKIGSPSRVMRDEIGKWIPAGVAVGIEKNTSSLATASASMGDAITSSFPAVDTGVMSISSANKALKPRFDATNGISDSIVSGTATALNASASNNQGTPQTITLYAYPNGPKMDEWIAETYNRATRKGLK